MASDLTRLIESLSRPQAYPHAVDSVVVHQTHISVVFLAGPFAYKIKKPVNLGFLDFSTLKRRKHFCAEEVRLNRRLAPHVYVGVVPITSEQTPRIGGDGPVIEWAVQMQRLPAEATLEQHLLRGAVTPERMRDLAKRLAAFHREAEGGSRISAFGRFAVVAQNARDNFTQTTAHVGTTVSAAVFERVRALTEAELARHRHLIETRADGNVPRDTHGDLHLDHVYLFENEPPPNDLVIIDCIEFSERFRCADPVADMAFLAMDLSFNGRRDLAHVFADAYFDASGDAEGRALLPLYAAYRAIIRAKVEGIELGEKEIDIEERSQARQRARAHWLLALGELETPTRKPALVLLAGLPGSGKSTIAQGLSEPGNFHVLRSDVVRKALTGADPPTAEFHQGIYSDEWTERTYAALLTRTEELLWQGERVLIDANFRDDRRRQPVFDAARRWAVPIVFIQCKASGEATRTRLQARHGDASDADWRIYRQLEAEWATLRPEWLPHGYCVDTSGTISANEAGIREILQGAGLMPR